MLSQLRSRLTYANVMATVAVFIALGGSSYAALRITGKNVKDSSLTGRDVKNRSLTGSDVKKNSLGGSEVKESTLGEVPRAGSANGSNTANIANTANNISPPEPFREVDTSGNPSFGANCGHLIVSPTYERVGFYKDHEGVVHLRGAVSCTGSNNVVFQLPAGYRPADGKILTFITA